MELYLSCTNPSIWEWLQYFWWEDLEDYRNVIFTSQTPHSIYIYIYIILHIIILKKLCSWRYFYTLKLKICQRDRACYSNGLMQDCNHSIANVLELLWSNAKPRIQPFDFSVAYYHLIWEEMSVVFSGLLTFFRQYSGHKAGVTLNFVSTVNHTQKWQNIFRNQLVKFWLKLKKNQIA